MNEAQRENKVLLEPIFIKKKLHFGTKLMLDESSDSRSSVAAEQTFISQSFVNSQHCEILMSFHNNNNNKASWEFVRYNSDSVQLEPKF